MHSHIIKPFALLALIFIAIGCNPTKRAIKQHPVRAYLPTELQDLYFGMPLSEFEGMRSAEEQPSETYDFRRVFFEEFSDSEIEYVVYYFDNEGDLPLYEIIVAYRDADSRDQTARRLLGSPNAEEGEWRYDSREGYELMAWAFQKKLVFAAPLPGTEWNE